MSVCFYFVLTLLIVYIIEGFNNDIFQAGNITDTNTEIPQNNEEIYFSELDGRGNNVTQITNLHKANNISEGNMTEGDKFFYTSELVNIDACFAIEEFHRILSSEDFRISNDTLKNEKYLCKEDGVSSNSYYCACDPLCSRYRDCCQNSKYFVEDEQNLEDYPFSCVQLDEMEAILVIASCPIDWEHNNTRIRCQQHRTTYLNPLLEVPVTSLRTNITYRNVYCAMCNKDLNLTGDIFWSMILSCNELFYTMNEDKRRKLMSHLQLNENTDTYYLDLTKVKLDDIHAYDFTRRKEYTFGKQQYGHFESDVFRNFTLDDFSLNYCNTRFETTDFSRSTWRTCDVNLITSCPHDWHDEYVKSKCKSYTARCHSAYDTRLTFRNPHCALCNSDSYEHRPIRYRPRLFGEVFIRMKLLFDWKKLENSVCLDEDVQYLCLGMCNGTDIGNKCRHKWRATPVDYIFLVALSLSVVCLVLHLIIFAATPKLMNLPAMNLASLSVSLLLLYCAFILTVSVELPTVTLAVAMHYALLTSFCWMFLISFDIWRVIRESSLSIQVEPGPQWRRFIAYSAFSWITPMVIVSMAALFDLSDLKYSLPVLKPSYSKNVSWLGNSGGLIVFVVIPVAIVMSVNIVFYAWGAFLIYSLRNNVANMSSKRRDFLTFLRLAIIMGLTWVIGVVAAFVNSEVVWYLFVMLNTLQGLFIFIAFSCRTKVWSQLSTTLHCLSEQPYELKLL